MSEKSNDSQEQTIPKRRIYAYIAFLICAAQLIVFPLTCFSLYMYDDTVVAAKKMGIDLDPNTKLKLIISAIASFCIAVISFFVGRYFY